MKKILLLCCIFLSLFCQAKTKKQFFSDIHPYAFYYLTGGDYNVSDVRIAVVSVNASKFKLNQHPQEVSGMKLYSRSYKQQRFVGYTKSYSDWCTESFSFSVYKQLTNYNDFIIDCIYNGGGSFTFIYHLFIKKHRKNYYDSGEIKTIDVLTCEGYLGRDAPSNETIEKVEKFTRKKPQAKEIKISDKDFQDIHPYAFYYLSGGDYRLQDTERGIISVNASKFKLSTKSDEVCHKIAYIKDNKIGFTYEPNSLDKDKKHFAKDNFYITVYKKLSNLNYYIVKCVFTRDNNIPRVDYLLIREHYKYYYYLDKFIVIEVLTCDGDFGGNAPSNEEIKKVEQLISQKSIGNCSLNCK